jgi:hypothetical protein
VTRPARTLYDGLLRALVRRGKPGDADRALAVSELTRARQLKDLLGGGQVASVLEPLALGEALRARLREGEVVAAHHIVPGGLLSIVATREGTQATLAPLDAAAYAEEVRGLRAALADPTSADVGARLAKVGAPLTAPLGALPPTTRRVYVLPDGVLNTIPWAALPLGDGRPLIRACAVAYLPGVEWLLRPERERGARAWSLLALADPVYGPVATEVEGALEVAGAKERAAAGIAPLPETREEAEAIAPLFPGRRTVLLGADAKEGAFKRAPLADFTHLHLATHGVLSTSCRPSPSRRSSSPPRRARTPSSPPPRCRPSRSPPTSACCRRATPARARSSAARASRGSGAPSSSPARRPWS